MYSFFSETIRDVLFLISRVSLRLAQNGFTYHGTSEKKHATCFMAKYTLDGKIYSEPCDEFIHSTYARTLPRKQLDDVIDKITEARLKNKTYKININDDFPDLFIVKNTVIHFSNERLLRDVVSDSNLLENLDADSIRLIINSAIKLSSAGHHISAAEEGNDAQLFLENSKETPLLRVVK